MLRIIFERPSSGGPTGVVAKISVGKNVIPDLWSINLISDFDIETATGYNAGDAGLSLTFYNNGFIIRLVNTAQIWAKNITFINLFGNYNFDDVKIIETFDYRVEVRNENGVLITDNGKPWIDGTYPPDAKNRAAVAGLHAAPVASSNKFSDLSGLDPNKEEEITEAERGAGVERALEVNENNGL